MEKLILENQIIIMESLLINSRSKKEVDNLIKQIKKTKTKIQNENI
jgi:hypothetical protein